MSDSEIRKSGTYNTKRQEYLDLVIEEFKAFDPYKLDRIWAIMFDNLRSILKNRGGNDYEPEHTRKRKRQKDAGTAVDLTVPMEDYHECVRLARAIRWIDRLCCYLLQPATTLKGSPEQEHTHTIRLCSSP